MHTEVTTLPASRILIGDVREQLRTLPAGCVHCCVTSPPYWGLRDYGVDGQLGSEPTPDAYVAAMVDVFREVKRVLRDDGTLWLNIGDSYCTGTTAKRPPTTTEGDKVPASWSTRNQDVRCGTPPGWKTKDLIGIPWMLALALRSDGWYLRSDIIWSKPAPMPESVRDRPTKAHEYIFLLTESPHYSFDIHAIQEPVTQASIIRQGRGRKNQWGHIIEANRGAAEKKRRLEDAKSYVAEDGPTTRNPRSVWRLANVGFKGAHFATFPPALPERCILAGTSEKGCCPACGKPWVREVAKQRVPTRPAHVSKTYVDPEGSPYEQHSGSIVGNRDPERHITSTVTVGWRPGCACNAGEPVPCVVLDPFLGSGTTLMVANALGRDGIGCELNPEYAVMAEARIAGGWQRKKPKALKRPKPLPSQAVLFD